jgi:hypothetical protein
MIMKMEVAVSAETPTRLYKITILNKIYNTKVYWIVTVYCSQAACTRSQKLEDNQAVLNEDLFFLSPSGKFCSSTIK